MLSARKLKLNMIFLCENEHNCAVCAVNAASGCVVGLSMFCVADMQREQQPSDTRTDIR